MSFFPCGLSTDGVGLGAGAGWAGGDADVVLGTVVVGVAAAACSRAAAAAFFATALRAVARPLAKAAWRARRYDLAYALA
jgi:hypothetical protein